MKKLMKNELEILAPAGNADMLGAAVRSGADAVYLGLTSFNARRSAGNFTPEQLAQAVSFCHARGVRVHVALNTTLYTDELDAAADAVRAIADAGADAVIVQDLAAARLVREICPSLALHASTQMSVHTAAGVRQLAHMGFARAILARELSLAEIRSIAAESPIELEVFVHGALCMSMSGQCYMSAFLGGRSGNRGSCAGTCRLPFDAGRLPEGQPGRRHHLSLKDNSILDSLPELRRAGVVSVKIEGRLRTCEYVAAAVNACRCAREGLPYDAQILQNVFSRSGFTKGYIERKIDRSMFGIRTEEDAALTRSALPRLRELYRREMSRVPVEMDLHIEAEGAKLTVSDGKERATVYSHSQPRPAEKEQEEGIRRALSKTGGTPFFPAAISISEEGGPWYLPGGEWNELRRTALEKLLQKRAAPRPLPCRDFTLPAVRRCPPSDRKEWAARFECWEQVPPAAASFAKTIILPIDEAGRVPAALRSRTILELPRALFGSLEQTVRRQLAACADAGFAGYLVHGLAQLNLCAGLPVYGGFGLNVTNALAAEEYQALGARGLTILPEVTLNEMACIRPGIPTAAFAYGHMPLMLTRACPLQNVTDCAHCSQSGLLTDRMGKKFPVRCGLGMRTVYNPIPIYMGDRVREIPADCLLAWFTIESADRAAAVLKLLAEGTPFDAPFTRGLYYKGTV